MDSVIGWVIGIVILLLLVSAFIQSATKNVARAKGQQKCSFCGAHLKKKAQGYGYADHCARCGKAQPWAVKP